MVLAMVLPTALHMVVGNVVEPKWFGHSLELHPVVVLLALAFWFAIWGVPGTQCCTCAFPQHSHHHLPNFSSLYGLHCVCV